VYGVPAETGAHNEEKQKMKNLLFVLTILAAVMAMPAFAQTAGVSANVPNDFIINGHVMPAGEYEVAQSFGSQTALIRSIDHKASAMVVTWGAKSTGGDPNLTFRVVDGKYYLVAFSANGIEKDLSTKAVPAGGMLASIKALPKR
jgi:hypothetical protein